MNPHYVFFAAIAAASAAACASVDQQPTSAEAKPDKVYTTGSRIPVRDRNSGSAAVRSVDNKGAAEIIDQREVITKTPGGNM